MPNAMVATMMGTRSREKPSCVLPSLLRAQSGVVRSSDPPLRVQRRRHVLRLLPRVAVHDRRAALPPRQQRRQLPLDVVLGAHGIAEVRAVEARHEDLGPLEVELLHDVPPHPLRRRRRQRQHGGVRELLAELPQVAVVGPELVPPLGDAVRLVDRDQADRSARSRSDGTPRRQAAPARCRGS